MIQINLLKLERGTHTGRVKVTRAGKTFWRKQRIGRKEKNSEEKKLNQELKYYPEMDKYFNDLGDKSEEVEKTIIDYTRSDYIGINHYLRTGIMPMEHPTREDYDAMNKKMNIISKFLKDAPKLKRGEEVYRGINFKDQDHYDKFIKKIKIGSVMSMKGYTSCSKSDEILMDFMGITSESPSVVLMIKSLNGVYLDGLSNVSKEEEVLISNRTAYKVEDISKSGNVTTIILNQYK